MIWSLEKMLLKKQVTRRMSTVVILGKKLGVLAKGNSAPPSSFPLGCGAAPSSKWYESSSGGWDGQGGSAIPAGSPEPDHPVWALGSITPLWGALQSSPLMCGISQQLWGASRLLRLAWSPGCRGGRSGEQIILAKGSAFLLKNCMGHRSGANELVWSNSNCLDRQ